MAIECHWKVVLLPKEQMASHLETPYGLSELEAKFSPLLETVVNFPNYSWTLGVNTYFTG